jgi:Tol biopolymer transport system component
MVAAATDVAAPLRLLPVRGGPTRQLTETRAYDIPLRWMPDGDEVFVRTQLDGQTVYMLQSVDGGATRAVALPEPAWRGSLPALSDDGRYVVWLTGEDTEPPVLKLFDAQNGTVRVVTDVPCRPTQLPPGWDGDRFLYCDEDGTRHEYRASTPDGVSRRLLTYEADAASWPGIGVRGDRVAFTENRSGEGSLMLARAPGQEPRQLVTLPGRLGARGMQGPVWSPDGRVLVVGYARPGAEDVEALVVRVTDQGEGVGEPTILELEDGPAWWWDPQWLPDGSAFVTGGMYPNLDTGIWLVSLDPATDPEELTADDPNSVWHFALSPDGRRVVYSGERPSGASFWKVEFTEMVGSRR